MCTIKKLEEDLSQLGLYEHVEEGALIYLSATSRKTQRKFSITLVGPSSVGKSYTQNRVLELLPPVDVLNLAGMTTAAFLMHADLGDKVVVLNEHFGDAVFESLLRQLISEGQVFYEHVLQNKLVRREVKGPTVVMDTTIDSNLIDFQNRNRSIVLNFRLTPQDIMHQVDRIKTRHTPGHCTNLEKSQQIVTWHQSFQASLDASLAVIIPYAECIEFVPTYAHHKRLFENFLAAVETIAFLDQHCRVKHVDALGRKYIEATIGDFEEALRLFLLVSIETGTDTLPDEAILMLQTLKKRPERFCANSGFDVYKVVEELNQKLPADRNCGRPWTLKRARRVLAILEDALLVTRTRGAHNIALFRLVDMARNLNVEQMSSCLRTLKLRLTDVTGNHRSSPLLSGTFPPRAESPTPESA